MVLGSEMLVSEEQPLKHALGILVTPSGITISPFKLLQLKKQSSPNSRVVLGSEMLVSEEQPLKHILDIFVTPSGITIFFKLLQVKYLLLVDYQYYTL